MTDRDRTAPDASPAARRLGGRVLLVSHSDLKGGAARAAFRLLQGLRAGGVDATMLAPAAASGEPAVMTTESRLGRLLDHSRMLLDRLPLALAKERRALFSPAFAPDGMRRRIARLAPDLVHLHWINGGTMRVGTLRRLGRPVLWTLHDMWPFTGGCHYDDGCGRYTGRCGRCPVLGSKRALDLSSVGLQRKRHAWSGLDLHIVAPSRWLAERAEASTLFAGRPIAVIPNGLDLARFRPVDQGLARDLLGLPQDRRLILFGAASSDLKDRRKGFDLLERALEAASDRLASGTDLLLAGRLGTPHPATPGFRTHALGDLHDELSVILAISAADLVVVPSRQDNLPNMAVEAAACGRPCVAFETGGLVEIVDHQATGVLAPPFEPAGLAAGIHWVLEDRERWHELGRRARAKAERTFALNDMVERHVELYRSIIDRQRAGGAGKAAG